MNWHIERLGYQAALEALFISAVSQGWVVADRQRFVDWLKKARAVCSCFNAQAVFEIPAGDAVLVLINWYFFLNRTCGVMWRITNRLAIWHKFIACFESFAEFRVAKSGKKALWRSFFNLLGSFYRRF
jgi:hypothetical protein